MNNSIKYFLFLAILGLLLLSPLSDLQKAAEAGVQVKTGDYVQFGNYYNQPILWRVIHIDEDGDPLLYTEYIISLKAYDSAGGTHPATGAGEGEWGGREKYGSNNWEYSNIRQWLNSDEQQINWLQNPPSAENVRRGWNPYEHEKGFLAEGNFTAAERNSIKPVTHKVLLASVDEHMKDGGSGEHDYGLFPTVAALNYDRARYRMITDKVFFLSVKELVDYVYERGWEYRKMLTHEAVANSNYSDFGYTEFWNYWLRCPITVHPNIVGTVHFCGQTTSNYAIMGSSGVAPACYLNLSSLIFKSGSGTIRDPYVITGNPQLQIHNASAWAESEIKKAVQNNLTTDKVLSNLQGEITREEFCELVVKLYEAMSGRRAALPALNPFNDTGNPDILKANNLQIVSGVGNNRFAPNDLITREQIAVMFYRTLEALNPSLLEGDYTITFTDNAEISNWAEPAVAYMSAKGILGGVGDNKVAPQGRATREQAIALIVRIFEKELI